MRLGSRWSLLGTLLLAAGASLLLVALVGREHGVQRLSLAELYADSPGLSGMDADDAAFFSASETFSKEGDRDLLRSDEAMRDKDLKLALHLARDSERAYKKGLADRRLVVAEKVEQQLASAISAKQDAHRSRISEVLKHAEEVNAQAQAAAVGAKRVHSSAPKLSSAAQVNLLRQSQELISESVPQTAVAAAAKRIAALASNSRAKLSTMDDPDAVLNLNPKIAMPPTHTPGNQWDANPVPKVLDCGPLSNDCNTAQGGSYYAKHHKKGDAATAGKKGAFPMPHPPQDQPPRSIQASAAAARFAMLAKVASASASGASASGASASGASIFSEPLLAPTTRTQDARQRRWLESGTADAYLRDLAALSAKAQQLHEEDAAADGGVAGAGVTMKAAGDRLDEEQAALNKRREALFAEYVGPLALMDKSAPLAVTVDRFASEWVPPGGLKVPSMLKVTPLSENVMPPPAALKAKSADDLKEPALSPGMEGLSLEDAFEALNNQQITLNKQRAELWRDAVGGAVLPTALVLNEAPALLEWQAAGLPTVTAATVEPLSGFPQASSRAAVGTAAVGSAAGAATADSSSRRQPAVDYLGREFVAGASPHTPSVHTPSSRSSMASPPLTGAMGTINTNINANNDAEAFHSRFLDEKPAVHHANPRNKVADLMDELGVHEKTADASFTPDPYDPSGYSVKSAATLLRAQAVQNAQGGGGSAAASAAAGAHVEASDLKNLNSKALNSKYETATKVFKAASAAYKAADATWKDLEAKEAEASEAAEPAARVLEHVDTPAEPAEPASNAVRPLNAATAAANKRTAAAVAEQAAHGGGSTAPEALLKTDKRHYLAKAAAGEKKAAEGGKGVAAPLRKESGNDKVVRKKRGLEQYKDEDAQKDLDSFFDGLIAHRVAVGHDRFTAPHRDVQPVLSSRETERKKEDQLLQASDLHRVTAKELEQAEEQTVKDGQLASYVGSELPKKSALDSRKELDDFYDSMPGGKASR